MIDGLAPQTTNNGWQLNSVGAGVDSGWLEDATALDVMARHSGIIDVPGLSERRI